MFRRSRAEQELDPDDDGLINTSEMDELDKLFPVPTQHPVAECGDGSLSVGFGTHWKRDGDGYVLDDKRSYPRALEPYELQVAPGAVLPVDPRDVQYITPGSGFAAATAQSAYSPPRTRISHG